MAYITKRKNGRWQAVVYMGRDENGKPIRRAVTKDTMMEAKRAAREIEATKEVVR